MNKPTVSSPERIFAVSAAFLALVLGGCNSETAENANPDPVANAAESLGIGPVKEKMTLEAKVDSAMAAKGKEIFANRCTACHKVEAKYVGPALLGVTRRRRPEWIMNMILNPTEMTEKDETAKELLATFSAQMANQNLKLEEARAVLEYFREFDSAK